MIKFDEFSDNRELRSSVKKKGQTKIHMSHEEHMLRKFAHKTGKNEWTTHRKVKIEVNKTL